jgi:adenine phosphoribosyltransferase
MTLQELKTHIRDIPDFPKPGIVFKDITPLIGSGPALAEVVERIAERYRGAVDTVLGIESRGFIVGAPVAHRLGLGLTLVRKPGKLPHHTYTASYQLEYGSDSLQIHQDAFATKSRVLIVDDLLATGGTTSAAIELVRRLGGEVVACAFIIELSFLKGRQRLQAPDVFSLITYDSE